MIHLIAGAILIGFAPIFVKGIHLTPTLIGFYRCFIAVIILSPFVLYQLQRQGRVFVNLPDKRKFWRNASLGGLLFALDLFCWHRCIVYSGAGIGTVLANTQVFYLAAFGFFYGKESPGIRFLVALPIALLGVIIMTKDIPTWANQENFFLGVFFGLLAGFFYSGFVICLRKSGSVGKNLKGYQSLTAILLFAALFSLPLSFLDGPVVIPPVSELPMLLGLSIVVQIVAWILISKGLSVLAISRSGLVLLTQPVVATIAARYIYSEKLDTFQIAGACLTLFAIYLGGLPQRRKA